MSGLLTGAPEPGPYAGDAYPVPPAAPPADDAGLIPVVLTNSVRTSAGIPREPRDGPWLVWLPPDEAARVVADRVGTYGTAAPRGYLGSAEPLIAALIPRKAPPEAPR